MENIILPSKVEITPDSKDKNKATVIVEPCYYGYGTTLGNALRRVMLSSLPGAAVTSLKIKGATHEFSTIPNVQEDVLEIILNFKELRLKVFSEEPVKLTLKAKGEKEVTAKDISKSSDVEIINEDLLIATLTHKDAELDIEITVNQGRGYQTSESKEKKDQELGTIMIDSVFTPVLNVGYKTENVRVGQITNYDKLIMTLETDGTVTPKEVFMQTVQILLDHFNLLLEMASGEKQLKEEEVEEEIKEKKEKKKKIKK